MNTHFVWFLFDVSVWLVFGFCFSILVNKIQRTKEEKQFIAPLLIVPFSLLSGLFVTLVNGLPNSVFAVVNTIQVICLTVAFSYLAFKKFRKKLLSLSITDYYIQVSFEK